MTCEQPLVQPTLPLQEGQHMPPWLLGRAWRIDNVAGAAPWEDAQPPLPEEDFPVGDDWGGSHWRGQPSESPPGQGQADVEVSVHVS